MLKQYKRLLEFDNVELVFEDDAVEEIAKQALERKTGARGLRAILEEIMLDIMFDVPSRDDVAVCTVTRASVLKEESPKLTLKEEKSA